MADYIREKGLATSRIGIAGFRFILSAGSYAELHRLLPDVTFVSADDLMDKIRSTKSELEIVQERELWTMAKSVMTGFGELVKDAKGVSQRELIAEATKPVWAAGSRDLLIFIAEEPGTVEVPADIPLRLDDKLRFHLEICGESGHWCEITINCAFQPPNDLERKLIEDAKL